MAGAANTPETRGAPLEIRARGRRLEGYAALFGSEARIGSMIETIRPGAFTDTLASKPDILALVDHDPARVLARTRSGTLRLAQDTRGLAFDLDIPDTTAGRDVLALAERGDLGGMSFGFRATDEAWAGDRRELRKVALVEISIVQAFPAYDGTVINARARGFTRPPGLNAALLWLQAAGART
jgi:HK97 family phage prohead protease